MGVLTKKAEKNKTEKLMDEFPLLDEIVLSRIVPLLSMKDVARCSVVSHTWLRYWRHTPILTFEDPGLNPLVLKALEDTETYPYVISSARVSFLRWVNNITNHHKGCTLEEFKVVYSLNNNRKVIIDRWVVWALSKHVQRLVLDFTLPCGSFDEEKYFYVLDRTLFNTTKLYLTTLSLTGVNVDTLTLNYILDACASTLENLCIVKSQYLTTITGFLFPSLKYFMVMSCPKLEAVDIQAPKLVSLTYHSGLNPILKVFNIQNASKLSYADISARTEQLFLFVLRSLIDYFSHLEHLSLQWHTNPDVNMVLDKFPILANLKHLQIFVSECGHQSLNGWVPFIGACPRLEKLTLEIRGDWLVPRPPKNVHQDKCPLRCLKTFEIRNFHGTNLDVDIANFVVENGINLQVVILHPIDLLDSLNLDAPFASLEFKLPPHVKLAIVK